jgi:GxxExxY protein
MELLHKDLTDRLIAAFYDVYNVLGYGFLEKVYQNALYIELISRGFHVEPQKRIKVFYKGREVGDYIADMVIDEKIIIELKAHEYLLQEHENQLINYLRATDKEIGLLLNFGPKPEFRRKAFDNNRKNLNT